MFYFIFFVHKCVHYNASNFKKQHLVAQGLHKDGGQGGGTKSRTSTWETGVCVPWETVISCDFFPQVLFDVCSFVAVTVGMRK